MRWYLYRVVENKKESRKKRAYRSNTGRVHRIIKQSAAVQRRPIMGRSTRTWFLCLSIHSILDSLATF